MEDIPLPMWNYDTRQLEWFTLSTVPYTKSHEAAYPYLPTERAKHLYDLYHDTGMGSVDAYLQVSNLCKPGLVKLKELNDLSAKEGRLIATAEALAYLDSMLEPEIERLEQQS